MSAGEAFVIATAMVANGSHGDWRLDMVFKDTRLPGFLGRVNVNGEWRSGRGETPVMAIQVAILNPHVTGEIK